MDLRWRLFGDLAGFVRALLMAAAAWMALAPRQDVAGKTGASAKRMGTLPAAGSVQDHPADEVAQLRRGGQLRHVDLCIERSTLAQPEAARRGGPALGHIDRMGGAWVVHAHHIPLDDRTRVVSATPGAEIGDDSRMRPGLPLAAA